MNLRVAVQMDPIETINLAGDSTFALMLAAQSRGHRLWHYLPADLSYRAGQVIARARPVTVQRVIGDHFTFGDWCEIDLAADADAVLMRQDPPFDMAYITATHLLEMVSDRTVIVNDPREVRNAPEKLFVTRFPDLMPETIITRRLDEAMALRDRCGEIVVKPLYGNAGAAVFHIGRNDANLPALVELFGHVWREPFMVQQFLPDVSLGDKRIVLVDGQPTGAINRLPKSGEIRSNLAAGGRAEATALTPREQEICSRALRRIAADLAGHTAEGYAYRVDFRLRPYGSAGQLVYPLPALLEYYRRKAALWEVQALLKARPVAGDLALGQAFREGAGEILRLPRVPAQVIASIRRLRAMACTKIAAAGGCPQRDLKNGPGGIRDLEFLVQGLQLIHAGGRPELLNGNTLASLALLAGAGILTEAAAASLRTDYILLRRVEHCLQLFEDRQVYVIPQDPHALAALARRAIGGDCSAAAFAALLDQCRQRVQRAAALPV